MRQSERRARGFALYEVLIGVTIFVVGVLSLGRSVENCMGAVTLSAQEDRVRQILSNRMAEVQATPGAPDAAWDANLDTGYGPVKLRQVSTPADLKDEKDLQVGGIHRVALIAEWSRNGVAQTRRLEFYVYRAG
jgi:Tfp pilus assembly protein PilV